MKGWWEFIVIYPHSLPKRDKTLKKRMSQKTLDKYHGSKTLTPYYKYIVKDSPKTLFGHSRSTFTFFHFPSITSHTFYAIIPTFFHTIPHGVHWVHYVPIWIHSPNLTTSCGRDWRPKPWSCRTTSKDDYGGPFSKRLFVFISCIR